MSNKADAIEVGMLVKANRDLPNKNIIKGDIGKIMEIENIDSENYLHLLMQESKIRIGPSVESCWDLFQ